MTPLELLAVGVIVVLVWMCGMRTAARYSDGESPDFAVAPFFVGAGMAASGLVQLIWLGIKEAAK